MSRPHWSPGRLLFMTFLCWKFHKTNVSIWCDCRVLLGWIHGVVSDSIEPDACIVVLIFSCDQAALWMVFSVRLSVCPSVRPSVRPSVCPSVRLSVCHTFSAATKQLYEWYFLSVCPSVRLSVCLSVCPSVTPFWLCSHHRIIMKFSGVITLDQGKVHAKGQGQRSKVKVTEVTTQIFVSGL